MTVPVLRFSAAEERLGDRDVVLSDLHVHTTASDALASPEAVVARARELGIRVGVADHNVIDGALAAWEAAGDEGLRRVVPAIEVTTLERVHVLVYFRSPGDLRAFHDEVLRPALRRHAHPTTPLDISLRALLRRAGRWDSLTSAAHPYAVVFNGVMSARRRFGLGTGDLFRLGAVEVVNGAENARNNQRALRLAKELRKGITAGSDAHMLSEIGAVMVVTHTAEDLFEALRKRRAVVIDRTQGRFHTLLGHSAKLPFHVGRPVRRVRSIAREFRGLAGARTRRGRRGG